HEWIAANITTSHDIAELCIAYADIRLEFLETHQNVLEQLKWYETALHASRHLSRIEDEAKCLHAIGILLARTREFQEALTYHEKALELLYRIEEITLAPQIYNHIGNVYWVLGDREKARQYHQQSLSLAEELGNSLEMANALKGLGYVAYADDRYEE